MRAGQEAAREAARRRAALDAAAATRGELAAYWARHRPPPGLPQRAPGPCEQAGRDAADLATRREKEKNLESRRNKLAMMLFHEDMEQKEELKMYKIESKMHRRKNFLDSVSSATLREVNLGIKAKEDERRRQEAEIMLYHQWRTSQPVIVEYERKQRHGALKSAWMDQIIEREKSRKQGEEENARILRERDSCLRRQIEREEEAMLMKEQRMKDVQAELCQQISDLQESEKSSAALKRQEEAETILLQALRAAGDTRRQAEARRAAARQVTLSNMAMQARRLKERAQEAEKDVEADLMELKNIAAAVDKDMQREESGRREWKLALDSALESLDRQRQLEKSRQKYMDSMMDGEARAIFSKQEQKWREEHAARQALLNEVLSTLRNQVNSKLEENRKRQRENIIDRELLLAQIERANTEMQKIERLKEKSKSDVGKISSLQVELKQLEKKERESCEKKQRELELREAAREEERLRNEIVRLQREGGAYQMHRRRKFLL